MSFPIRTVRNFERMPSTFCVNQCLRCFGWRRVLLLLGELNTCRVLLGAGLRLCRFRQHRQENAEASACLKSLRNLASPRALVMRDGTRQRIAVVTSCGRLMILVEGDRVPADATSSTATICWLTISHAERVILYRLRKKSAISGHGLGCPGGDDLPFVFAGTLIGGAAAPREWSRPALALRWEKSARPSIYAPWNTQIEGALSGGSRIRLCRTDSHRLGGAAVWDPARGPGSKAALGGIALGCRFYPKKSPSFWLYSWRCGALAHFARPGAHSSRGSHRKTWDQRPLLCLHDTDRYVDREPDACQKSSLPKEQHGGRPPPHSATTQIERRVLHASVGACRRWYFFFHTPISAY
jgi:hypothetical protein